MAASHTIIIYVAETQDMGNIIDIFGIQSNTETATIPPIFSVLPVVNCPTSLMPLTTSLLSIRDPTLLMPLRYKVFIKLF